MHICNIHIYIYMSVYSYCVQCFMHLGVANFLAWAKVLFAKAYAFDHIDIRGIINLQSRIASARRHVVPCNDCLYGSKSV